MLDIYMPRLDDIFLEKKIPAVPGGVCLFWIFCVSKYQIKCKKVLTHLMVTAVTWQAVYIVVALKPR